MLIPEHKSQKAAIRGRTLKEALPRRGLIVDAIATRREMRRRLKERRRALTPMERMNAAQGLRASLERLPEFLTDERIAGYWACDGELPLNLAIAPRAAQGQRLLLPLLADDGLLQFAPWQAGEPLYPNRFGIPEPESPTERYAPFQLDVVLLPLLGFERHGHRLGHGGGWYDRSFAFLKQQPRPTSPLLIGVGYSFQEVETLIPEEWDVELDYIATEGELIDCRQEISS